MKKQLYLFAAALLLLCTALTPEARAQIKKGDILLGGNLSFYHARDEGANSVGSSETIIGLYPSFGKAIKDNLVLGLNLEYSQVHWKANAAPEYLNNTDTYGGGVFVRRYKYLGSGFSAFIQGDLNYLYTKQKQRNSGGTTTSNLKTNAINAGFDPGIAYAISKKIQVETGFQNLVYANYSHSKSSSYDTADPTPIPGTTSHSYSFGTTLSSALQNFIVGFRILI